MKNLIIIILVLFTLSFTSSKIFAQGYKISVKINGSVSNEVQLGYYYEDQKYLVDQKITNQKGEAVFSGNEKLPRGIYMIILASKSLFLDFLIAEDQEFEIRTDTAGTPEKIKITGSEDNKVFLEYQSKMDKLNKKIFETDSLYKDKDTTLYNAEHKKVIKSVSDLRKSYSGKYPGSLLANLIDAMDIPEASDSLWSKINFNETGLIRTPFFNTIMLTHLAKNIDLGASKIIYENNKLLEKASVNPEMLQYISFYMLNFYRSHQRAGLNEAFVDIADNYYLNNKIPSDNPKLIPMIQQQRDIYACSMIGNKAKNVKTCNMTGDSISLFDYKDKYILVYFWSSGCGHCEKASEHMKEKYPALKKKGFDVYAFNTNEKELSELEKYMDKNPAPWQVYHDFKNNSNCMEYFYAVNSPLVYVLNKDRIIIAKLNGEEQITEFIENNIK